MLTTVATDNQCKRPFWAKRESGLHVAAAPGAGKASTALLVVGADQNLRDRETCSPLSPSRCRAATNDLQKTPLHLASSKGHALCISELLGGGADKDAVDSVESIGTIRALLEGGANVNVRDELDETPHHAACIDSIVGNRFLSSPRCLGKVLRRHDP
ncbi:unnamed protein product [Ectocarpus sp. CCAP 1310/34]|nr:unnamed protein product [Ectocarpus sp. CCAP 1310/34]